MAVTGFLSVLEGSGNPRSKSSAILTAAIDYTAFAAALADAVADGATPTEAHVTAVNDAWTTLKAAIDAAVAQPTSTGVIVQVDLAQVATITKLRAVFNDIIETAKGNSLFTG
jgi:hypothetical protein